MVLCHFLTSNSFYFELNDRLWHCFTASPDLVDNSLNTIPSPDVLTSPTQQVLPVEKDTLPECASTSTNDTSSLIDAGENSLETCHTDSASSTLQLTADSTTPPESNCEDAQIPLLNSASEDLSFTGKVSQKYPVKVNDEIAFTPATCETSQTAVDNQSLTTLSYDRNSSSLQLASVENAVMPIQDSTTTDFLNDDSNSNVASAENIPQSVATQADFICNVSAGIPEASPPFVNNYSSNAPSPQCSISPNLNAPPVEKAKFPDSSSRTTNSFVDLLPPMSVFDDVECIEGGLGNSHSTSESTISTRCSCTPTLIENNYEAVHVFTHTTVKDTVSTPSVNNCPNSAHFPNSPTSAFASPTEDTVILELNSCTASSHYGDMSRTDPMCGSIASSENSSEIVHSSCEKCEGISPVNPLKTNHEAAVTPTTCDTSPTSANTYSKKTTSPNDAASLTSVTPIEKSIAPECNPRNTTSMTECLHPTSSTPNKVASGRDNSSESSSYNESIGTATPVKTNYEVTFATASPSFKDYVSPTSFNAQSPPPDITTSPTQDAQSPPPDITTSPTQDSTSPPPDITTSPTQDATSPPPDITTSPTQDATSPPPDITTSPTQDATSPPPDITTSRTQDATSPPPDITTSPTQHGTPVETEMVPKCNSTTINSLYGLHPSTFMFENSGSVEECDTSLTISENPHSPNLFTFPARREGTILATCMSTTASAPCRDLHRTNSLCGAIVSSESSSEIFHSACESTESVTQTNCVKTNREAACTPPILDKTPTSADNSSKFSPSPDVLASPTQPVNPVEGSTLPKRNSVNTDSVNANSHPTNSEGVFVESNIEPYHSVSGSDNGCASASDTLCDASLTLVNTCSGNAPFPELNVSTSPTARVTPVEKATSPECNSTSQSLFHDIASNESSSKTPCSASESSTLTERVSRTKTNHKAAFTPTTCCTSPNSVKMSSQKTSSPNVPTALIPVTPVEKNTMPKYNSTRTTSKNDRIHLSSPNYDKVASSEGKLNVKTSHLSSESSTYNESVIRVKANCKAVSATISISLKEDVLPTSIDNSKNAPFPPSSDIATSPTYHNITPVDTPTETQLCCTEEHENKTIYIDLAIRVSSTQLLPLVTNSVPAGSPTPLLDSSSSLSPVGYIPSKEHSTAIRIIHSTVLNDQSFQLHDSENTANLVGPQSCVVEVFSEKITCRSAQTCETLLRHRSTLLPLILPSTNECFPPSQDCDASSPATQSPSEINNPSPTCTFGRFTVYLSSLIQIKYATKACLVLQRTFGRAIISSPQFCMHLQSILRGFDLIMCSEGAPSVDLSTYNLKSTRSETCSFVSKTTHCILFPTTTNVILHANRHDEVGSSRLIYTAWNIFKQQNILLYYAVGTCCIDKDYFVDVFRDQKRQGNEKARKRKEQRRITLRPPRHTKSQMPLQIKHFVQFFLIHQTTPISGHLPTNSIQTWSTSSCSLVKDNHTQQQTSSVECSMESCASSITSSPPYSDQASVISTEADTFKLSQTEVSEPSSGYTSLTTPNHSTMLSEDDQNSQTSANLPAVYNETFFRQTLLPKQEHGEPWDHTNNELVFPRKQISEEQSAINLKLSELVAISCFSVSLTAGEEAPPLPVWKAPAGEAIEGDISDSKGKSSDLKYFNNDEGQVKADPLQSTETEYFDEAHYTNNSFAYTGTKSDYLLKPVLEVFSYNAEQQHPTELCKLDSCNDLGKSALAMDQLAFMPCPIIPFRALCGNDSDIPIPVDNVSHLTSNSLLPSSSNALDHQFHCVQDLVISCQPAAR